MKLTNQILNIIHSKDAARNLISIRLTPATSDHLQLNNAFHKVTIIYHTITSISL